MALTKVDKSVSSTPGIVDNSDATAITIDSSENVGIGTTSPSNKLHLEISGNNGAYADADNPLFLKNSSTTDDATVGQYFGCGNGVGVVLTTHFPNADTNGEGHFAISTRNSSNSLAERMRITSGGVVDIKSGGSSSAPSLIFEGDTDTGFFHGTNVLAIATSGSERMRIDSSGRVLIGNTDGLAKFCVGNGSGNALIEMASSSATAVYYEHINRSNVSGNCNVGYYARAAGEHTFYTGSYTARFIINSSGGSNASDEKLKENIQNLSYGLDTVKSLKPRQFKWKDNQQQSIGFVAQEVESLIPEVVSEVSADIKAGTDEKIKALNYANLTAVLTKAIQEQQAIIEDLQTQINEVKNGN